jgi:hypothetical protein
MTATRRIDFDGLRATLDLAGIITADLGPSRGGRWLCPFHDDHNPSLTLTRDRQHWRCWSCGAHGDVVDWVAKQDGVDRVEAALRLDPAAVRDQTAPGRARRRSGTGWYDSPSSGSNAAPAPPKPAPEPWQSPAWQAAVETIVREAEERLWSPAGRDALDWLRWRGLDDLTIRRFRLGFIARDGWGPMVEQPDGPPRSLYLPRGITLPWVAPGAWYGKYVGPNHKAPAGPRWVGCNIRRLAADPFEPLPARESKCQVLKGTVRGCLYPWADIPTQGAMVALLVEGEFDALVAEQEVGHLVVVGTVGGATTTPDPSALVALARCSWWLIALDHDEAGVAGARDWYERAPHKARRVILPHGKDLGEFAQSGGDVGDWLRSEMRRLRLADRVEEASVAKHPLEPGATSVEHEPADTSAPPPTHDAATRQNDVVPPPAQIASPLSATGVDHDHDEVAGHDHDEVVDHDDVDDVAVDHVDPDQHEPEAEPFDEFRRDQPGADRTDPPASSPWPRWLPLRPGSPSPPSQSGPPSPGRDQQRDRRSTNFHHVPPGYRPGGAFLFP